MEVDLCIAVSANIMRSGIQRVPVKDALSPLPAQLRLNEKAGSEKKE
jgi:hypothetical protein